MNAAQIRDQSVIARVVTGMQEFINWASETDDTTSDDVAQRLAQCEALLAQISAGVVVLQPAGTGSEVTMRIAMINEVAQVYFGRVGNHGDPIGATEDGLRSAGIIDSALMVSLTGQAHFQEAVQATGTLAVGHIVDLSIIPLEGGAVTVTFDDVTAWATRPNRR